MRAYVGGGRRMREAVCVYASEDKVKKSDGMDAEK